MEHIRAVINQAGVTMELHDHVRADRQTTPIVLTLIRPAEIAAYQAELAKTNPDYRHATLGQLAVMYANRIFQGIAISQSAWSYNASTNTYVMAR